mmetsp:Transcript_76562/g.234378  ORF Transcript_76562/g.234378 Transcript_76562/m.234378 type:complete len:217 (-) Transcript_76562:96-746(-)
MPLPEGCSGNESGHTDTYIRRPCVLRCSTGPTSTGDASASHGIMLSSACVVKREVVQTSTKPHTKGLRRRITASSTLLLSLRRSSVIFPSSKAAWNCLAMSNVTFLPGVLNDSTRAASPRPRSASCTGRTPQHSCRNTTPTLHMSAPMPSKPSTSWSSASGATCGMTPRTTWHISSDADSAAVSKQPSWIFTGPPNSWLSEKDLGQIFPWLTFATK